MYINVRKINKRSNINFRNTILLLKIRILTHIFYIAIAIFYRNCDILSQLRYFAIAIFAIFRIYFFAVTKRNETAISCGNSASRNTAGNPRYGMGWDGDRTGGDKKGAVYRGGIYKNFTNILGPSRELFL